MAPSRFSARIMRHILPTQNPLISPSASFGIVGLECALPLYRKALIDTAVLDWPAMLAMMTCNPARLVGLDTDGLGESFRRWPR